ncbi:MAG TPA: glycogen/starch/alpha-glucan phosphorylase [Geminicoccaceae bacterium]|jgi:starch phosphorylase|nr:glycogen/starch/alpha-glucan phosphorylase [Geminicoccaceae bacterium]
MTTTTPEALRTAILSKLAYAVGKDAAHAQDHDWYVATALAIRDQAVDRWIETTRHVYASGQKRVYYLSLEFLIGRLLGEYLCNLQLFETCRQALAGLDVDLERIRELEPDAALGNGGLGRLAACFMESMATVGVAGFGYGIRYQHGLFRQLFHDGWQVEQPEDWLAFGNPWEFERPEVAYEVGFGGTVERRVRADGREHQVWHPGERVLAIAYDTPIVGWPGHQVNTLRLWSAQSANPMRLDQFNRGDYLGAVAEEVTSESIVRVLYPNDDTPAGQELRLKQEYFFTSASLHDLLRRHLQQYGQVGTLSEHVAIQLNDTHPAIAVAELIRLLVDEHDVAWDEAWRITQGCIAYTNHTLLPEALESWPISLLERLLPRHMQIIHRLNADLLQRLNGVDVDPGAVALIDHGHGHRVRMGHLAFYGAHKVNGVSALHTELMQRTVFRDLNRAFPGRITNKTNGIAARRWLRQCNPALSDLISDAIGVGWLGDLEQLEGLLPLADDAAFRDRFAAAKRRNKERLAALIAERTGMLVDPAALFDVHVKRIHEYKRQLLNILGTIASWQAIRAEPGRDWLPRVKIFGGKAAASYRQAKLIIKLINDVARVINHDPLVGDRLKVIFLPNYNVSLTERIIPAADLSEQISTAGMEASGTGNMKLALNGAVTIGTLDGANIEIRELVGHDNMFIFGLTAEEVRSERANGYDPRAQAVASPALSAVLEAIGAGEFSPDDAGRFRPLIERLLGEDYFMVLADFAAYGEAQQRVDEAYREPETWWRRALLNTANVGWFSSDRTIREYAGEIWQALPGPA